MSDYLLAPWTVADQAPLSIEFYRQKRWHGLPFLSPGDLPDPRIKPTSPALQIDSLPLGHLGSPVILVLIVKYVKLHLIIFLNW